MARTPRFERPEDEDFSEHDLAKKVAVPKRDKPGKARPTVKSERTFYILLGAVITMLLLLFFGYQLAFGKTRVMTLDELHGANLAGELEPEEGYVHNGFSFVRMNDQWWTRFQRAANGQTYNVQLRYGPQELADVPLLGDYVYFLRFNASFVTFDPLGRNLSGVALAAADISQAMVRVFDIATFPACTRQDNSTCLDLPIVGCEPGRPVVLLKEDKATFVEVKDTCIIVHGQGLEMVRAVDRLLLGWYGIMP